MKSAVWILMVVASCTGDVGSTSILEPSPPNLQPYCGGLGRHPSDPTCGNLTTEEASKLFGTWSGLWNHWGSQWHECRNILSLFGSAGFMAWEGDAHAAGSPILGPGLS